MQRGAAFGDFGCFLVLKTLSNFNNTIKCFILVLLIGSMHLGSIAHFFLLSQWFLVTGWSYQWSGDD